MPPKTKRDTVPSAPAKGSKRQRKGSDDDDGGGNTGGGSASIGQTDVDTIVARLVIIMDQHYQGLKDDIKILRDDLDTFKRSVQRHNGQMESVVNALFEKSMAPVVIAFLQNELKTKFPTGGLFNRTFKTNEKYGKKLAKYGKLWMPFSVLEKAKIKDSESIEFNLLGILVREDLNVEALTSPDSTPTKGKASKGTPALGSATSLEAVLTDVKGTHVMCFEATTADLSSFNDQAVKPNGVDFTNSEPTRNLLTKLFQLERQLLFIKSHYDIKGDDRVYCGLACRPSSTTGAAVEAAFENDMIKAALPLVHGAMKAKMFYVVQ